MLPDELVRERSRAAFDEWHERYLPDCRCAGWEYGRDWEYSAFFAGAMHFARIVPAGIELDDNRSAGPIDSAIHTRISAMFDEWGQTRFVPGHPEREIRKRLYLAGAEWVSCSIPYGTKLQWPWYQKEPWRSLRHADIGEFWNTVLGFVGFVLIVVVGGLVLFAAGHLARSLEGSIDKWLWSSGLRPYGDMAVPSLVMFGGTAAAACICGLTALMQSRRLHGGRKFMGQAVFGALAALFTISALSYGLDRTGHRACMDENGDPDYTRSYVYYVDADDGTANYYCLTPEQAGLVNRWRPK